MDPRIREHKVAHLPLKPLLLYDGSCNFCLNWTKRLYHLTNKKIDFGPFQHNFQYYPEIPEKMMASYVHFIEMDGTVYYGAAAAYKILTYKKGLGWLFKLYKKQPAFRWLSEESYEFISRYRHRL